MIRKDVIGNNDDDDLDVIEIPKREDFEIDQSIEQSDLHRLPPEMQQEKSSGMQQEKSCPNAIAVLRISCNASNT